MTDRLTVFFALPSPPQSEQSVADHLAFAVTLGARGDVHELPEQRPRSLAHLPHPVADAAGPGGRAGPGPASGAGVAPVHAGEADPLLDTGRNLLERQPERYAEIFTALGTAPTPAAAEQISQNPAAEHVVEVGKDIFKIGCMGKVGPLKAAALERAAEAGVPVLVVDLAFLGITEDLIRFRSLLESGRGLFIARVPVGVIFHRLLAIGFLDVALGRAALQTQYVIIVAFGHYPIRSPRIPPNTSPRLEKISSKSVARVKSDH